MGVFLLLTFTNEANLGDIACGLLLSMAFIDSPPELKHEFVQLRSADNIRNHLEVNLTK